MKTFQIWNKHFHTGSYDAMHRFWMTQVTEWTAHTRIKFGQNRFWEKERNGFGRERGQKEGDEGSMRKGREATIYSGSQSTGVFWDLVSFHKRFLWKGCPHQTQNWEWGGKRCACRGTEMVDQAVVFVCLLVFLLLHPYCFNMKLESCEMYLFLWFFF